MISVPPTTRLMQILAKTIHVPQTGCSEWQGCFRAKNNYPSIYYRNKQYGGHRLVYELVYGKIPEGMLVRHSCDNMKCLNPEHLSIGTTSDNMRDKSRRGRNTNLNKTHCPRGHEYSLQNTIVKKRRHGYSRDCRACKNKRDREYHARKRAEAENGN